MIKNLQFNEKGLIPAIAQDADTGEVLMLGYMDEEALRRTLSGDEVWFYSRRRHRGCGTKGKPQAIALRCAQYGRTAIAFWLRPTPPVQCVIPVIRPASFNC